MHNDFDDIEDRLKDFQSFEYGITNDIWDGIESNLLIDNSLNDLNNLEVDVTDDIWEGIETQLKQRDRKPVLWWASGIAASLALLFVATTQLTSLNNNEAISLQQQSLNDNSESNELNQNSSNTFTNPVNSENQQTENSNSQKQSKTVQDNNSSDVQPELESSARQSNHVDDQIRPLVASVYNTSNNVATNSATASSTKAVNSDNTSNPVQNTTQAREGNINNTSMEEAMSTPMNPVLLPESDNELIENKNNVLNGNPTNGTVLTRQQTEEEEIVEEEVLEENILVANTNLKEEEEEEDKLKRKIGIIAFAGVGSFTASEEFFEVVKPVEVAPEPTKPKPNDTPDKSPVVHVEDEPIEEGDGINYVKYSPPISLSMNANIKLSNRVGIRSGVMYTQMTYYYEVYGEGNKLKLHYVGLPVEGVFTIINTERVRINTLIGGRVEKMVDSKYLMVNGEDTYGNSTKTRIESNNGVNSSLSLGAEFEFKVSETSSFILNSKAVNYLSTDSQIEYDRNIQSVWPELNLGYMINF